MKCKTFYCALAISLLLVSMTAHSQNPWSATPNWVSNNEEFTMSVALADLDNDGYLDLVAGNYKYPYSFTDDQPWNLGISEIGAHLVAY